MPSAIQGLHTLVWEGYIACDVCTAIRGRYYKVRLVVSNYPNNIGRWDDFDYEFWSMVLGGGL